jgi:hypothetical protein
MLTIQYTFPDGSMEVYEDEASMFSVLRDMESKWEQVDYYRKNASKIKENTLYDVLPNEYVALIFAGCL